MVKVISQETFDAVVRENVEEFGMDPEEARLDAIKQFESQGVDLSNIITTPKDVDDSNHAIVVAVNKLESLLKEETGGNELEECLEELERECQIDLAHRIMAVKHGAFEKLTACLKNFYSIETTRLRTLRALAALTQGHPDGITAEAKKILVKALVEEENVAHITLVLCVIRQCCVMHEKNREAFMIEHQLAAHLRMLLERPDMKSQSQVIRESCQLVRAIVADDDVRVEFGRAHEYACMIADQENGLAIYSLFLTEFEADDLVLSEVLPTLSKLAVRNEFCKQIVEHGGLKFTLDALVKFYDDKVLVEKSLLLLKALAGNDDVKRDAAKMGVFPLITAALNRHKAIPAVAEAGCAAVAALTLRMPENSAAFAENAIAIIICDILKIHQQRTGVVRQSSLAIRNMVSRRKDLAPLFLEAGIEELLRGAMQRQQRPPVNELKAALRDLGCKVHLEEQWTGKGAQNVTN